MSFCANCGTEIRVGAKFCTKCGAKIEDVAGINTNDIPSNLCTPIRKNGIGSLKVERVGIGAFLGKITTLVDGNEIGVIKKGHDLQMNLPFGQHSIKFKAGWQESSPFQFVVNEEVPCVVIKCEYQNGYKVWQEF